MSQGSYEDVLDAANENEIIVALEHVDLVTRLLREAEVPRPSVTTSDLLQLARLELDSEGAAAKQLSDALEAKPKTADYEKRFSIPPGSKPLDVVLQSLRRLSAADFGGWAPTLGKNRLIFRTRISGETGWGGVGEPRALDEERGWHRPPDRRSGPGRGARAGVLDTALFPHEWLAGGWVARHSDIVPPADNHLYSEGHATFLAGLILSQAPGATVEVRQVLDLNGTKDAWSVANAIVDIGHTGLDVLNLSFTAYTSDAEPPLVLATAIDRLDPEIVVVAAAGNHAEVKRDASEEARRFAELPAWPAALDDVVAVGAVDTDGNRAPFSPDAPWVDIYAPGVDVRSTYLDRAGPSERSVEEFGGWAEWSGTSFAAALVSGVVAATVDSGRVSGREAMANILESRYLKLRTW